ncbi:hypothetical protein [Streptomyces sp. B22F1]|uniref:hypothetical protein n=1 Tax=Streptomyces sp. B22F1 TaxID=3153566 RepID=UPI00325DCDA2
MAKSHWSASRCEKLPGRVPRHHLRPQGPHLRPVPSGANLGEAFPDITAAAASLGEELVLDGELVVPDEGRLAFDALQRRVRRRGRSAAQAAAEYPPTWSLHEGWLGYVAA